MYGALHPYHIWLLFQNCPLVNLNFRSIVHVMGDMKTLLVAFVLLVTPAMNPAAAAQTGLAQTFASCAGRLSATMEMQWILSDPNADRTQSQRAAMIELLESVTPDGAAAGLLNIRIDAKMAHAALLTRASFGNDPAVKAWAAQRAELELATCLEMMLG